MEWTAEQKKVIDARNRNLLVSAAAGSGKTAVLVERVLAIVLDPENPVDIDRLLIVTFTNAAAREMRTRLHEALLSRAEKDPENRHLLRQLQLVQRAQVSTIDSFCLYILRNYPEAVDLDPAFRIMDQGEEKLLQSDVLDALLEEEYERSSDGFLRFLEGFSSGKSDEEIRELVLSLYRFSQSHPWPDEWLESCLEKCRIESPEELAESDWCSWYLAQAKLRLSGFTDRYRRIVRMAENPLVPPSFAAAYRADIEALLSAREFHSYGEAQKKIGAITFQRQPAASKKPQYSAELQERVKNRRAGLKKRISDFQESFALSEDSILSEIAGSAESIREIVRLVRRFSELYAEEKKKKGIADFSDVEHRALSVLYDEEKQRTDRARELSLYYHEIMIDEYQDSNRVQEAILTAVSKIPEGRHNIFMVGDMKQSIYRFRMADPSLFTEKYQSYTREESDCQLLGLSRNFRSRREVTRSVNWFFFRLMQRSIGGIDYDLHSALYYGAEFPAGQESCQTEILLTEKNGAPEDYSKQETEAALVGQEIRALMDAGFRVSGKDAEGKPCLRPLEYKDIVILLRTASGWDQAFLQVLESLGIPVYVESRSGYFDAPEVRLALNLLTVIDNPINDIPLASVLHSQIFGFSAGELSEIRAGYSLSEQGNGLYGAIRAYQGDPALTEKIRDFLRTIEAWRKAANELPLSVLLRQIYRDTGLLSYVSALPSGERRAANLRALLTKAANFEQTSYHGIFHFIRYVDKLRKYQADEGEQNTAGEDDNVVRIMTIHKSKGLEFPVVFLSGCGKQFNLQDQKKRIILHQDYGIAADLADPEKRIRKKTFMRRVFAEKNLVESLGEELRVLYVGMSRAKEKLYLTGLTEDLSAVAETYADGWEGFLEKPGYGDIADGKSYLSWLLLAYHEKAPARLRMIPGTEIRAAEEVREAGKTLDFSALLQMSEAADPGDFLQKEFDKRFGFRYDDVLSRVYATLSVSALKAVHYEEETERAVPAVVSDLPADISEDADPEKAAKPRITGAERGTLVHRVMERLDPERPVREQLSAWLEDGTLRPEERSAVSASAIEKFLKSPIGQRFVAAHRGKRAFRERRFIIGIPASLAYPELSDRPEGAENLMLQGIVDLYFEEDGALVIVDYKTDYVQDPEVLLSRYRIQLDLYARALTQSTGKPVREKWIYSFSMGKEIPV